MAVIVNRLALLALLCAVIASVSCQVSQGGLHGPQGGPHQNQGRIRRQAEEAQEDDGMPNWVPCDFTTTPAISCADCNTRMICKPVGGLLKQCKNPFRPYCNNGICSATPLDGC